MMIPRASRKRPRNRAVDYAVYLAVRLIVCLAQAISIERAYVLADALAGLTYRVDRRHRSVAMQNLEAAYGDRLDEADRDRIVREVYRHILRMLMEMLHLPRVLHLTTWRRYIRLSGHAAAIERLVRGGPMILLSGHYGNWEMAGYLFGAIGYPPNSVARALDNPHLERFLRAFRERTGQRMIAKKGGSDAMVAVLEGGGLLSMLGDQDAGPRGQFVEFFGRPASTFKAIALLSHEFNAPIVVGCARRISRMFRYEVEVEDLIEPDPDCTDPDSLWKITQRYTTALERMVRRDPTQYFWLPPDAGRISPPRSDPRRHRCLEGRRRSPDRADIDGSTARPPPNFCPRIIPRVRRRSRTPLRRR